MKFKITLDCIVFYLNYFSPTVLKGLNNTI